MPSRITKVNRLEIKGFKSFANKTELLFGDHFNCVLGPNGSGKSNVMDALCFVLGKGSSKDMRAEKSSNLIYNGGKLKNPAKDGEVSIFFDNTSKIFPQIKDESKKKKNTATTENKYENEIKITRIIKENGQSSYKINDKTKTRQEILDLLAFAKVNPDGYNIVLQGEIVNLIEMSPLERREMLEQIAGLSIYEEKKERALRELQRVEEKMNEVEIILAERKTHLQELKRDRDQALKFKDLNDKIKMNKATILNSKIVAKTAEQDKFSKDVNAGNAKIAKIRDDINKITASIDQKKHDIEKINREIEDKGEREQVAIHKEVEKLKIDLALSSQRVNAVDGELHKIAERRNQLQNSVNDIAEKIQNLLNHKKESEATIDTKEKELVQIESKIKKFLEKNNLDSIQQIDKDIEQIDKDAEILQEEIQKFREQQQHILREKDKTEILLRNIDESIENVLKLEKENKEQLEVLKKKKDTFKKTTLELNTALSENSSLAIQIETARSKIFSRKEELVKLNAKSMSIKESIAAGIAVQKILEMKDSLPGIFGLVSNLGNVRSEYSVALEVAAGNRIRSIVVEDDKIASECIKYLKEKKFGVATFLPLNKIRSVNIKSELKNLKTEGIKGLAIDLISYDPKFEKVFSYVFENTLIVENIETARKIGIGNYRMVTMQGDLIESSGAMQGGFRARSGVGFAEKDVSEGIEKLEKEIEDASRVIQNLEQKRTDNEETIAKLRESKSMLDGEIIAMEKILHLDSNDLDISKKQKTELRKNITEHDKDLDSILSKTSEKNRDLAQLKIKKQQLRDRINELRNPALIAELNAFEQKRSQLREETTSIRMEIKNNDSQIATVLNPERENIAKILKQQDKEKSMFEEEKSSLEKKIKEQQTILKDKEEAESKFFAQFKELFNKRNKLADEVSKHENESFNKQEEARGIEQKINLTSLQAAEIRAQLASMIEEFKQYEGVELYKDKPESEILREIAQFEKLIVDIGAVNMRALEIYEKIEQEYKTFIDKKEKILKERESVLVMINEIDSRKKELFMKTYEIIDHNFKVIFSALSTKGEASLELEDANDPFNGGLLLKVRITGTKFLDIKSLSGGEKTMAAIAFIFAVQEYDPAPFYIFDEVDAALDKKNSEQLAQLIKNYSGKAQYIIISHNDGVISEADTLYGVSMNEFGISKVTSLRI
jgi:chromosome segregation protein